MKSKEIPILFNGDMVRAILSGSKTQTRRPIKNPEQWMIEFNGEYHTYQDAYGDSREVLDHCFGKAGDVLWVRESTKLIRKGFDVMKIEYVAGGQTKHVIRPERIKCPKIGNKFANGCFKEACRIKLKVKRVWVERVQDITDKDARLEGAPPSHPSVDKVSRRFGFRNFTHSWFGQTWNRIYGTWDDNPWVWCCEFEVIATPQPKKG